jgi:hypothetical protein
MQPRFQSSLPRPWEEQTTFNDSLFEWMQRAPWLALSAGAHALLLIVLMAIPWDLLHQEEPVVVATALEQLPAEVFEETPPEEPEPIEQ